MAAWRDGAEGDVPAIHRLLRAMAAFEKLEHEFRATEADYRRELFGPSPSARALVAEAAGQVVAACLYHRTFPSFSGRPALWIEDIFVEPEFRRRGIATAAFAAVAQEDDVVGDDFGGIALLAILIVVAAGLQTALDVDLLPLGQVGGEVFGPPEGDVVPFGLFLPLAGLLVLPAAAGGDGEAGDTDAGRRKFRLRIAAEIAD